MKKVIRLNEADLEKLVKKVIKEHEIENSRYMFFSNLQQMRRQCDMLLEMDPDTVEEILQNGHDWAQDHIAEAKNNIDQVFDFLMNETKKDGMESSMNIDDVDMMDENFFKKAGDAIKRGAEKIKDKINTSLDKSIYKSKWKNDEDSVLDRIYDEFKIGGGFRYVDRFDENDPKIVKISVYDYDTKEKKIFSYNLDTKELNEINQM
jgi:ElaB/YqjD/DUF883 family membrane-anchored ribosome-binding protein